MPSSKSFKDSSKDASPLSKQFAAAYKEIWQESVIQKEAVTFTQENGVPCVRAFLTCEKEIGKNQEIFVEKISD